jgi:hypothetical protein
MDERVDDHHDFLLFTLFFFFFICLCVCVRGESFFSSSFLYVCLSILSVIAFQDANNIRHKTKLYAQLVENDPFFHKEEMLFFRKRKS